MSNSAMILGMQGQAPLPELVGYNTATNSTSISLNFGHSSGDLLFLMVCSDSGGITTISGWTLGQWNGSSSPASSWFYKISDGTETSVTGLDGSSSAHLAFAFKNIDQTTPLDVSSPTMVAGAGTTPNPPAITTVTNNAVVIAMAFQDDDNNLVVNSYPTGYTAIGIANSSNSYASSIASYKIVQTAGSEDPSAYSLSLSDGNFSATAALRPA
jgi:hypothetical protein